MDLSHSTHYPFRTFMFNLILLALFQYLFIQNHCFWLSYSCCWLGFLNLSLYYFTEFYIVLTWKMREVTGWDWPSLHSHMTVWHSARAVKNSLLSGQLCPRKRSTSRWSEKGSPPHEKQFQLRSSGCTGE